MKSIHQFFSLLLFVFALNVSAQDYPSRAVKMVVGSAPGSSTDVVGRVIAEGLYKRMGQPFVIENRAGANGMPAAESVARAAPDGYTLLVGFASQLNMNTHVYANVRYDAEKDFAPITPVITAPFVLLINPANQKVASIKSLPELIALAKAKPGSLTYGSAGIGSAIHIVGAQLASAFNLETVHVPYKGAALMETGLLGSEVDFAFDNLSGVQLAKDGKLRALAVTGSTRWPALPDVPTTAELGMPATLNAASWFGFLAPARTPDAIVQRLNREIIEVASQPATRETLLKFGFVTPMSTKAFAKQLESELQQNGEIVKKLGIKLD